MNPIFDPPDIGISSPAAKVLPWLWLSGEESVDVPLLGEKAAKEYAKTEIIPTTFKSEVSLWIDFRDVRTNDRRVYVPNTVTYVRMPFRDGDIDALKKVFPLAKLMVDMKKKSRESTLVSCHGGVSRSATFVLWCMAEEMGFESAWSQMVIMNRYFEPDERFDEFIREIQTKYKF